MRLARMLALLVVTMLPTGAFEHGGGCRRDSPPGKCCHMDNRAGRVHCH